MGPGSTQEQSSNNEGIQAQLGLGQAGRDALEWVKAVLVSMHTAYMRSRVCSMS